MQILGVVLGQFIGVARRFARKLLVCRERTDKYGIERKLDPVR